LQGAPGAAERRVIRSFDDQLWGFLGEERLWQFPLGDLRGHLPQKEERMDSEFKAKNSN
jgi:hypothetical protein